MAHAGCCDRVLFGCGCVEVVARLCADGDRIAGVGLLPCARHGGLGRAPARPWSMREHRPCRAAQTWPCDVCCAQTTCATAWTVFHYGRSRDQRVCSSCHHALWHRAL